MKTEILTTIIAISLLVAFLYLIMNFFLQVRAKRKLEILLRQHKALLLKEFGDRKKVSGEGSDIKAELMIMMLREEIGKLDGGLDKVVLQKTLNRKNYNNQKKFAQIIFDESELALP